MPYIPPKDNKAVCLPSFLKAIDFHFRSVNKFAETKDILFIVLILIALHSYYASLLFKCPYGELDPCRKWFTDEGGITKLLLIGAPSFLIFSYLEVAIFFTRRFKILPFGFIWCFAVLFCWQFSNGYDFINHGGYNRLVLLATILVIFTFGCLWTILDWLLRVFHRKCNTQKSLTVCKILFIIVTLVITLQNAAERNEIASRTFWNNPSVIYNYDYQSQSDCTFTEPKFHWWNIFAGVFNFASLSPCSGYDISWLGDFTQTNDTLCYAYPQVNTIKRENITSYQDFAGFALNRVHRIDEREKSKFESVLKIPPNGLPELTTKVVQNPKLIARVRDKRLASLGRSSHSNKESVLILLIDALSRQAMTRKDLVAIFAFRFFTPPPPPPPPHLTLPTGEDILE